MKIQSRLRKRVARRLHKQQGMAVIVVIALFAIMLLFLGMSLRSLNYLRQDLKLIERQQLQRIHQNPTATNSAAIPPASPNEPSATNPLPLSSKS